MSVARGERSQGKQFSQTSTRAPQTQASNYQAETSATQNGAEESLTRYRLTQAPESIYCNNFVMAITGCRVTLVVTWPPRSAWSLVVAWP